MKKILFYTDTPLLGGAENQMLLLAKNMPRASYEISIACASEKKLNPWCQNLMDSGCEVIRMKVAHKHDPRHFFYLKKILPKFDLLHAHIWNPASGRFAFLAAAKKPLVITEHDPFVLRGLKGWLKNKLVQKASAIIVASNAAEKNVLEQNPALGPRITVIPNGIDIKVWKNAGRFEDSPEDRDEFRRLHYSAFPNTKVILCAAELHLRKGQKYLIEAMKEVLARFPKTILALIGDGPARKFYEKIAAPLGEQVKFLGRRREVATFMAGADIFVLPSVREAFGLVLLEAPVVGLPVVATNVGGIPEIIEHNKTGLLVAPENSSALYGAICELLDNPEKARELANEAAQRVELYFNAKLMTERTMKVYDSLVP